MHFVERLSIKEIARRTGLHRNTIRRAFAARRAAALRPRAGAAVEARSVQGRDPAAAAASEPAMPAQRIRELIASWAIEGGKTILDDYLREVRPLFAAAADLPAHGLSARRDLPVRPLGAARRDPGRPRPDAPRLRRDALSWATRAPVAGALIFSKEAPDIALGDGAAAWRGSGALPRDAGLGPRGRDPRRRRPPDRGVRRASAASSRVGWRDPRAARLRRPRACSSGCTASCETNFEPGARVRQRARLPAASSTRWFDERANARMHRRRCARRPPSASPRSASVMRAAARSRCPTSTGAW